MGNEYRAKVFKSGNSVALRLPKGVGFTDGEDIRIVTHADGSCTCYRAADASAIFRSLYGSMSPGFMADGRGDIEQDERDWSVPVPPAAAA